jgi:hypothetical protein
MNHSQRLHEEGIVKSFIIRERQSRYLEFLNRLKRRASFTGELAHFKHLDPAFAQPVPPSDQTVAGISKLLKEKRAPENCWAISESSELDGQLFPVVDALKEVLGRGIGTFLSCTPGVLGYFEDEDVRFILYRSPES